MKAAVITVILCMVIAGYFVVTVMVRNGAGTILEETDGTPGGVCRAGKRD